ncbi:WhiB family transcriptional regulator [Actinacidiphila oryziradicis]|uniref:WhiB family transcriptional regulator n=1 Tax=Actinacidiphila oryziradicis TaxID=2571141 RepID=UPI00389945CE
MAIPRRLPRGRRPDLLPSPGERGAVHEARDQAAKEVCARCPVREPCLQFTLEANEPYGVWGGLTETTMSLVLMNATAAAVGRFPLSSRRLGRRSRWPHAQSAAWLRGRAAA